MKFALLVALSATSAVAQFQAPTGDISYTHFDQSAKVQHTVILDRRMPDFKERRAEYRTKKYLCRNVVGRIHNVKCVGFLTEVLPERLKSYFTKKYEGASFRFGEVSSISTIATGLTVKSYKVNQKVESRLLNKSVDSYFVFDSKEMTKFRFEPSIKGSLILKDKQFYVFEVKRFNINRWERKKYMVSIYFK